VTHFVSPGCFDRCRYSRTLSTYFDFSLSSRFRQFASHRRYGILYRTLNVPGGADTIFPAYIIMSNTIAARNTIAERRKCEQAGYRPLEFLTNASQEAYSNTSTAAPLGHINVIGNSVCTNSYILYRHRHISDLRTNSSRRSIDCARTAVKGAITSKIKHAIKLKTSPARLVQLLQPSLAFCCAGLDGTPSLAAS